MIRAAAVFALGVLAMREVCRRQAAAQVGQLGALPNPPPAPTWFGTLYAVEEANGRYREVPEVALGLLDGRFVTATDKAALLAGEFLPTAAAWWAKLRAVFYRRTRPPPYAGRYWRHEVKGTDIGVGGSAPVFRYEARAGSRAPRVCPRPAGQFICDG